MRAILISATIGLAAGLLTLMIAPAESAVCQGCGCHGGPGYRSPAGACVSWRRVAKICGRPPETRCTRELVAPVEVSSRRRRRSAKPQPVTTIVPNPFYSE